MDLLALTSIGSRLMRRNNVERERFNEGMGGSEFSGMRLVLNLISIVLSVIAAYLSWSCNTAAGIDGIWRIIRAVVASIFGLFYILLYAIFFAGRCGK
jgi:hypothetical protein